MSIRSLFAFFPVKPREGIETAVFPQFPQFPTVLPNYPIFFCKFWQILALFRFAPGFLLGNNFMEISTSWLDFTWCQSFRHFYDKFSHFLIFSFFRIRIVKIMFLGFFVGKKMGMAAQNVRQCCKRKNCEFFFRSPPAQVCWFPKLQFFQRPPLSTPPSPVHQCLNLHIIIVRVWCIKNVTIVLPNKAFEQHMSHFPVPSLLSIAACIRTLVVCPQQATSCVVYGCPGCGTKRFQEARFCI